MIFEERFFIENRGLHGGTPHVEYTLDAEYECDPAECISTESYFQDRLFKFTNQLED